MTKATSLSQALRIGAVLVVAFAIVYSIETFSVSVAGAWIASPDNPQPAPATGEQVSFGIESFSSVATRSHCGAAVLGAWRANKAPDGWFGYAPLTSTPVLSPPGPTSGCRGASRRRLELSGAGGVLGLGLALAARRVDQPVDGGSDDDAGDGDADEDGPGDR